MAVLRRIVIPALIALLVVAELATATVGASHIRADRRKAAAIAAERHAVASYQVALRPLVEQVFDAVQPLQDAEDALAEPTLGRFVGRADVLTHSGALTTLTVTSRSLKALSAPRTLVKQAKALGDQLSNLANAAKALAAATKAPPDRAGYIAAFSSAYDLLTVAEIGWYAALQGVYGQQVALSSPEPDRTHAQGRKVPTHGGFILQADQTCGQAITDLEALGKVNDVASAVRIFPKEAAITRRMALGLRALKADPTSTGFQHRLKILLTAHEEFPKSLDALASAARRHDVAAYEAAWRRLNAALPTLRDLSRALNAYGSRLCGDFYNVDNLLAPKGKGALTA